MPSPAEIPLSLRRWRGVNTTQDEAFVDPSFLRSSNNWVPDDTFLLRKRYGTEAYLGIDDGALANTQRVHSMIRIYSGSNRYLYAVRDNNTVDDIVVSVNDANFTAVSGGAFTQQNDRYDIARFGTNIYIGNGSEPMERITLGGASVSMTALASLSNAGTSAVVAADDTAQLASGTYSYCWAAYDTSTKLWVNRSAPQEISINATRSRITFTSPNTGLGGTELYHLFITPANLPIEFAHDAYIQGIAASTNIVVTDISISSTPVPAAQSVVRTGRFLSIHLNRLWIGGDQSNLTDIYASSVLLPGMEQSLFDQTDFFPANAVIRLKQPVTGLAPVTTGATQDQPQGPMALFTETTTSLWFGDIIDDPNAFSVQISGQVGCISHHSIVPTDVGLIFCARDSIYLLRPETSTPINIGWPIARVIRNIPRATRFDVHAIYHRGFYKLSIIPAGGTVPSQQWWLDLRNGLTSPPSWWGPHVTPLYTASTVGRLDASEDDRAWAAVSGGGTILLLDQSSSTTDNGTTILAELRSQAIDNNEPFQHKRFRRARLLGRSRPDSTLGVSIKTDRGAIIGMDPINLGGTTGATWDTSDWRTGKWGSTNFDEGESIFEPRPIGKSASLHLTHGEAAQVDLRDFELRYDPIKREVS